MRNIIASPGSMNEAMAHQIFTPDEKANLQQHLKQEPLPSSRRSTRHGQQRDAVKQSAARVSPAREKDDQSPNTRRRSRLACARCRKRKIKCSGENEDGLACTNCRGAGEESKCHFLRVKAVQCPVIGGATAPSPSNVGIYAPPMHQKPAVMSNVRYSPYSRSPNYYMGSVEAHSAFSRQSYGVDHGVNYEDPSSAVYNNGQAATHMLPSTPQGVWSEYYWNQREWNSNLPINRVPSEAIFPDQGTDNSLIQPAYSYTLAGQGTHRTLPNPPSQSQLITPSPEVTPGLPYSPEYTTSGSPWEPKCTDAAAHRGSMQNMVNGPFTTSPEHRIKPDPGTQDMVLGFVPTIPSPNTTAITSNGTYAALDTVDSAAGEFRAPPDSQFMRTLSRDNSGRLLSISAGSDYSPYSSNGSSSGSERGRTHSEASDSSAATLVNGLPYSPVKQVDAHSHIPVQHGLQFNLMASDAMSDYHRASTAMHRALQGY